MNIAEFAIRQRTFVAFFTVLCIIAGVASYFKLGKLEDPTFTVKSAVIVTLYPGASAKEVKSRSPIKSKQNFKKWRHWTNCDHFQRRACQ